LCLADRILRANSLKKTWMIKMNLEKTKNKSLQCNYEKERNMSKTHEYFQQELGLDKKPSKHIPNCPSMTDECRCLGSLFFVLAHLICLSGYC
jgi:hypothetical protein